MNFITKKPKFQEIGKIFLPQSQKQKFRDKKAI